MGLSCEVFFGLTACYFSPVQKGPFAKGDLMSPRELQGREGLKGGTSGYRSDASALPEGQEAASPYDYGKLQPTRAQSESFM